MTDPQVAVELPASSAVQRAADGAAAILAELRKPSTRRFYGRCMAATAAAGTIARRFPSAGSTAALIAGIYIGLECAIYMAEETKPARELEAIDVDVTEGGTDAELDEAP